MLNKIRSSFFLSSVTLFFCIYMVLLLRDIFFLFFVYIKYNKFYWSNLAFYDAFKATLPLYIPIVVLDYCFRIRKRK